MKHAVLVVLSAAALDGGPVTAVLRDGQLNYDTASRFARHERRLTVGGNVRLPRALTAQMNLLRQSGNLPDYRATPVAQALTCSLRLH